MLRNSDGLQSTKNWKGGTDHHHKHQGLDPLIRYASRVTVALNIVSSVFLMSFFLVVCSGMISRGFGFVTFFAQILPPKKEQTQNCGRQEWGVTLSSILRTQKCYMLPHKNFYVLPSSCSRFWAPLA